MMRVICVRVVLVSSIFQLKPCELSYSRPPLLKHPLRLYIEALRKISSFPDEILYLVKYISKID
jgi:hypothetical protein